MRWYSIVTMGYLIVMYQHVPSIDVFRLRPGSTVGLHQILMIAFLHVASCGIGWSGVSLHVASCGIGWTGVSLHMASFGIWWSGVSLQKS